MHVSLIIDLVIDWRIAFLCSSGLFVQRRKLLKEASDGDVLRTDAFTFAALETFRCFRMVHFTQAIGRGRDSFLLAVIRQLVFNIPLLFLFNHLFGVQGIVWTQLTADLFTVAVSYLIYFRIRKQEGWLVTI